MPVRSGAGPTTLRILFGPPLPPPGITPTTSERETGERTGRAGHADSDANGGLFGRRADDPGGAGCGCGETGGGDPDPTPSAVLGSPAAVPRRRRLLSGRTWRGV